MSFYRLKEDSLTLAKKKRIYIILLHFMYSGPVELFVPSASVYSIHIERTGGITAMPRSILRVSISLNRMSHFQRDGTSALLLL